jgi:hypothetical protein
MFAKTTPSNERLQQVSVSSRDPYDYAALPEAIRAAYSDKEWSWLSPSERVRAIRNETEPDWRE